MSAWQTAAPAAPLLPAVGGLFAAGALLLAAGHLRRRTPARARRADWIRYGVFLALISTLLVVASLGRLWLGLVLAALAGVGAGELERARHPGAPPHLPGLLVRFGVLFTAFAHLLVGRETSWFPAFALSLVLIASTDAFSQLWGRLLGAHLLCPRLSPGKTIEGLLGGLLTAVAVACALGFLLPALVPWKLAVLGLATASGAVAGDLSFSLVKRRAGIKDFSSILPGHGGVLDRFDSLAGAAPVFFWTRTLLGG